MYGERQMNNGKTLNLDKIPTPTIGEILNEEFLRPLDMTAYRLSKELRVSSSTILDLIHGKRRLTTDMALRLSRFFGTSEKFWINLQANIDVRNRKPEMEPELEKIQPIGLPT
jgi:addiction module HigA family antidote